MLSKRKRLPESELEVMAIIWQGEQPVPTGEILQQLRAERPCNLQMVQSTLNRLLDKEFIRCEKVGRLNYYYSLVDADEYRTQEAASIVEKLYGNSPSKLLASLVRGKPISPEERAALRRILEETED